MFRKCSLKGVDKDIIFKFAFRASACHATPHTVLSDCRLENIETSDSAILKWTLRRHWRQCLCNSFKIKMNASDIFFTCKHQSNRITRNNFHSALFRNIIQTVWEVVRTGLSFDLRDKAVRFTQRRLVSTKQEVTQNPPIYNSEIIFQRNSYVIIM